MDGKANAEASDTGALGVFELTASGGYTIVEGGDKFANLGLSSYARHLLVDFDTSGGGIVATLDRARASGVKTLTWQGNLGPHEGDGGVTAASDVEAGVPTFTLSGKNEGFVKGWVLAPQDAAIVSTSDPLQIETSGSDVDVWVVMAVGAGRPPVDSIQGQGLGAAITVAGNTVRYDAGADRMLSNGSGTVPCTPGVDCASGGGQGTGGAAGALATGGSPSGTGGGSVGAGGVVTGSSGAAVAGAANGGLNAGGRAAADGEQDHGCACRSALRARGDGAWFAFALLSAGVAFDRRRRRSR